MLRRHSSFRVALPLLATLLVACSATADRPGEAGGGEPVRGGRLTLLATDENFGHLDPQRINYGEPLAFAGSFLQRTLTSYAYSADPGQANSLVPDLATDTGTRNGDATRWSWRLQDGLMWEDGSELTCEDVKYGVSRTFATDVITGGPPYAISMLDIPTRPDGASVYKGPYVTTGNDVAAFDKAVVCDGERITFNLNRPVPDFAYTVALLAFSPVPSSADTGETYDKRPMSSGPYKIDTYAGGRLVLVRNNAWRRATDGTRGAFPDSVEVRFGLDSSVLDQRLIKDADDDVFAVPLDSGLDATNLSTVFDSDKFADRRVDALDPYVHYIAINASAIPNLLHRRAIATAINRAQLRTLAGGRYGGELADGVVKPNLPLDYAASGIWEGLLGRPVPDNGNPEYAKQLIDSSGGELTPLRLDYPKSEANDKAAASIVDALGRADIDVTPNSIPYEQFYAAVTDPTSVGDLVLSAWGPDWPNASTVIPVLFTPTGGFDISQADDSTFNDMVAAAQALTDRTAQAEQWKALNRLAMSQAWVVPIRFARMQRLAGSHVKTAAGRGGHVYIWSPYGAWPYGDMFLSH
jgi:peptide/nickel transport system substrate-binding protein